MKWAQAEHPRLLTRAMDAYVVAHRLACEEWTLRQFIGRHDCAVNLKDIIWPVKNYIHTLSVRDNGKPGPLRCARCGATKPNLIGLRDPTPGPIRREGRLK